MLAISSPELWYTTRATGVVALALLTLTVALGILTAGRVGSRSWPAFVSADLHKRISALTVVFLVVHVVTAVVDTYVDVGWASLVVPFSSGYEPLWTGLGTAGLDLLVAVALSSALRQRISARAWRAVHWLAYGSWPLAMAHAIGEGTDGFTLWMDALAGVCAGVVAASVTWRIARYRNDRRQAARLGASTRAVPALPIIGSARR